MDSPQFVEAIEEGRIVRVTENYAKREGLPILRKPEIRKSEIQKSDVQERIISQRREIRSKPKETMLGMYDTIRKKPSWKEKQVTSELIPNWQWYIRMQRRKKSLTRRQLSQMIHEPEESIRLIEMGCLPSEDFILLNKIQHTLNFNIRKDQRNFSQNLPELMKQTEENKKSIYEKLKEQKQREKEAKLTGSEIEILEDEI